jgi:putative DNA-binding protein
MTSTVAPSRKSAPPAKAETTAPTLSEMQAAFQRAVMLGDDGILHDILDNSRTNRGVLFGVYRHAYTARLIEVIRNDHQLLNRHLGDEAFSEIARRYIAARPSRNQNARWFSHDLPEFLVEARPDQPHIAELAALERAVNDAFDAPDAAPLTIADLSAIAPERWSDLIFVPHPSASRLKLTTNTYPLWVALKDEATPPDPMTLAEPEDIIVWRQDVTPKVRRMSGEEAMMWNETAKGVPFGALCELVAVCDDPDSAPLRAAQHLQGWIATGLLTKAMLTE